MEIDGGVAFNQFNADIPGSLKITNANGKFPFNKKLWLDKRYLPKKKQTFIAARKGFFSQLRGFSQNRNIFQVDQVAVQNHLVSQIVLDLLLKNNQLMAEKFLFNVLGGSAAGNFFLTQSQDGPELNFSTEFANLDFGELLKTGKGKRIRNADIDGNMSLTFLANPGASGIITMDQISLQVAITRIGAETLDRLLLFIDPEESKPAIVDTRAKLELASPHKIMISLENGNLNVEAWLKNKVLGDIIKAPELKRVPISGFKQFKKISEQLQSLTALQEALKHLAAVGIEFDENQNIVLY